MKKLFYSAADYFESISDVQFTKHFVEITGLLGFFSLICALTFG